MTRKIGTPLAPTGAERRQPSDARAAHAADSGANEHAIVVRAQGGDDSAYAELVALHAKRAYAIARAIVGTHEDAQDVVQDAFVRAHAALALFRPDQSFGAWLRRIVSNASLDVLRRQRVRAEAPLLDTIAAPFRDPAEHSDLRARLEAGLGRLTARQRSVIVLHDVQGRSHGEISEMLAIPEGTSRSDLHHARTAMRREFSDYAEGGLKRRAV